jgi:hypothetical protein
VLFHEQSAGFDDVFGFAWIQADGFDIGAQTVVTKGINGLGRVGDWVEFGGSFVDADIRGLRGKNYRNQ